MASCYQFVILLFFTLALARVEELSATQYVLKGSVTCLDCDHGYDLSGIKVLVKCSQVKKMGMATTEADGCFETELPSDTPTSSSSLNCNAKILGGPHQLYTSKKNTESKIVRVYAHGYYYTTSKPLSFYKSCPLSSNLESRNCGAKKFDNHDQSGASKTVDLPLPREWGLPPTSYYLPFIPIIGIP